VSVTSKSGAVDIQAAIIGLNAWER
jgi:hypothetical protein